MKRRTNMNVDTTLVSQAASVLGTNGTTQTVHAAMADVVQRAQRRRLAARDFEDLTPAALAEMRKSPAAG